MPHPNVETLRRIDQAQVAGDLETVLSQYTDDVLGHVGGDNKLSGDYRGLEQLQAMVGRFMEASGEYSFENHAYLADDEHGIVLERDLESVARLSGTARDALALRPVVQPVLEDFDASNDRFDLKARLAPPVLFGGTIAHPLGTDELGRDVFSRLIMSIRMSLLIALFGTLIATLDSTDLLPECRKLAATTQLPGLLVARYLGGSTEEAFAMARRAAREDGVFSGPSTGANLTVALQLARELGNGKRVATVQVDSGLKYLAGDVYG